MKKKLTILFAATLLLAGTTFANNGIEPSAQIKSEFSRLFTKSTEASWEAVSGLYKVTFQQGGQYLTAFFTPAGTIESLARNISVSSLPMILQKGVQDKLATSWVSECFELLGKNGTEYYVTVENATAKTIYHASSNDWVTYENTKK